MSTFRFTCPGCFCFVTASASQVGQEVKCSTCLEPTLVPQPGAPPPVRVSAPPTPALPSSADLDRQEAAQLKKTVVVGGVAAIVFGMIMMFGGVLVGGGGNDVALAGIWVWTAGIIAVKLASRLL